MLLRSNPYKLLGLILSLAGAGLTPVFYFVVGSVPFTAVGLSAVILGGTCLALANARPFISSEACQMLLKTGTENTAALLEELGVRNKAIYLPTSLRNGHAQALIPLDENAAIDNIREKLLGRLFVKYGSKFEHTALAVTTPGSVNLELLSDRPGPTAEEIESALTYLLSGILDIADRVRVHLAELCINVEVRGSKFDNTDTRYYECLGSPIASIAAAVSSEALERPVRIRREILDRKEHKIVLEILS